MSICINNNIKELNFIGIVNSPNNNQPTKQNNFSEPKRSLVSSKKLKPKNNYNISKNVSNLNSNIYNTTSNNNMVKNIHIVNINNDIYSGANILTKDKIMENVKMGIIKNYKMLNNMQNRVGSSTSRIKNPNINTNDQFFMEKKLNPKMKLKNNNQEFSTNSNTANSNLLTAMNKNNYPFTTSSKLQNARLEYNAFKDKFMSRELTGRLTTDKNMNHHDSLSENKNYQNLIKICNNEVGNLLTEGKNNTPYNYHNIADNKVMSNNLNPIRDFDKLDFYSTPYLNRCEKLPNEAKQKLNAFRSNTTSTKKNNYRSLNDNNENIILINHDGVYLKEKKNTFNANNTTKLKNNKSNIKKSVRCPEEIHFFFVNSIQKGKKLEEEFNNFNE